MSLIDADALIKTLEAQDYSNAPNTLEGWTPQDMTRAEICDINNAPTVDAVEVVRCKDCWYSSVIPEEMQNVGDRHCEYWCAEMHEDDYCSCGKRREDD